MHAKHAYAKLQQQMRETLRVQNPHWVEPGGKSPICDDYERRFAELLELFTKDEDLPAYQPGTALFSNQP